MRILHDTDTDTDTVASRSTRPFVADAARQPYASPALTRLGNLRGSTLGGSPGSGDSGNPEIQRVLPAPLEEYRGIP